MATMFRTMSAIVSFPVSVASPKRISVVAANVFSPLPSNQRSGCKWCDSLFEIPLTAYPGESVAGSDNAKIAVPKQLDDGVGDTLVSVATVAAEYRGMSYARSRSPALSRAIDL